MDNGLSAFDSVHKIFNNMCSITTEGPGNEVESGEVVIGVLKDPIPKGFYTEKCRLIETAEDAFAKHKKMHDDGIPHEEKDCQEAIDQIEKLQKDGELLMGLFWQGVHADLADNRENIGVRVGWQIVLCESEEDSVVSKVDTSRIAAAFLSGLKKAILAKSVDQDALLHAAKELSPIDHMNEEVILGRLTSPELLGLYLFGEHLRDLLFKKPAYIPAGLNIVESVLVLKRTFEQMKQQIGMNNALFWSGVRDKIPRAKNCRHIALRENWNVVSVPKSEEESEQEASIRAILNQFAKRLRGLSEGSEPPEE